MRNRAKVSGEARPLAEALHGAAQRLYDGVVEKLEAKAAEAALAE